jgi:hypothetical protein
MATVRWLLRRALTRLGVLALLVLVSASTGCVSMPKLLWEGTAPEPVCNLLPMWQNHPCEVPDTVNGGKPMVGLAGKLYLMDKDNVHSLAAEGRLVVEMYDETSGTSVPVERWDIHPNDLRRLGKKDMLGWTYIVFLPSQGLRPEMARVRLRTSFHPEKGTVVYHETSVTLAPDNGVLRPSDVPLTVQKASIKR